MVPGQRERENRIVGLIGVKGAGKTQKAKQFFRRRDRVVVLDPLAEYQGGFVVSGQVETLDYLCGTNRFRVIYRPLEEADFRFVCKTVWKAQDCLFIAEELGRYCDPQSIPDEFDEIVTRGRHRRIDLVYTVQRYSIIHRNVTAMTDEWYIFRQTEPVDLDVMERRFGKAVAGIVRDLDDLEAVHIRQKEFRAHDPKSYRLVAIQPGRGVRVHELHGELAERSVERGS